MLLTMTQFLSDEFLRQDFAQFKQTITKQKNSWWLRHPLFSVIKINTISKNKI